MNRLQKILKHPLLLMLQAFLTMAIGLSVVYVVDKNRSDSTVCIDGVPYTRTQILSSKQEIMKEIDGKIAEQSLSIEYGKNLVHIVKYADIDAYPDWDGIFLLAEKVSEDKSFKAFLRRNFIPGSGDIPLKVLFDKGKLEAKVAEIASLIDTDCVNAGTHLEAGKIVRTKHQYGRKVDRNAVLAGITEMIERGYGGSMQLRDGIDVLRVVPDIDDNDVADIQDILSEYATVIRDNRDTLSVHIASKAIDGRFIRRGGSLSFNRCLFDENPDVLKNPEDDGYAQVASTLYAALLLTGLEKSDITRTQSQEIPGYISPGLEAPVYKDKTDLSFNNSLETNIMIFSRIDGDMLRVIIAGKKNEDVSVEVVPETLQTFMPGTVTKANSRLALGETVVVNPGKEGVQVRVTRNIKKQNRNTSEVVSIHTYEPVDRVVEVGTNNGSEK